MRHAILTLLRTAAWAPIAVLVFHTILRHTAWRAELDWLMHFLGGVAAAYFLFHGIKAFAYLLGQLRLPAHYLLAYTSTCGVAVAWEIAEFMSDQFFGTHVQHSLTETMQDLIFGVVGAALSLGSIWLVSLLRRPH